MHRIRCSISNVRQDTRTALSRSRCWKAKVFGLAITVYMLKLTRSQTSLNACPIQMFFIFPSKLTQKSLWFVVVCKIFFVKCLVLFLTKNISGFFIAIFKFTKIVG